MKHSKHDVISASGHRLIKHGRVMLVAAGVTENEADKGLLWLGPQDSIFVVDGCYWMACEDVVMGRDPNASQYLAMEKALPIIARRGRVDACADVRARLNNCLAELELIHGQSFRITVAELAMMCGCSDRSAGLYVGHMQDEGLLERAGFSITLLRRLAA